MPKYIVTLDETVTYKVEVDAPNEEVAGRHAAYLWARSDNPSEDFDGYGQGVEVVDVEETTKEQRFI